MVDNRRNDMARRVIAAFPEAAATLQIAEALEGCLPFKSPGHLIEVLNDRPVAVMGVKIEGKMLEGLLTEESFPIEDTDTLAQSVAAAIRTGAQVLTQRDVPVENHDMRVLATKLVSHAEAQGPVAMGWFGNDSIFGFKRAVQEKEN